MTNIRRTIAGAALRSLGLLVLLSARASASAAEISDMAWDESNIASLRSASITDVEKLLCGNERPCGANVDWFEWADFEGKGRYVLVCFFNFGGKVQTAKIYQRDGSGKISEQSIDLEDYGHEDFSTSPIRDLNGDGKKELIINSGFGAGPDMAETPLTQFPLVYRLQDGQFAEASREFPDFYDKEVLPPLEEKISALKKKLDSEAEARASGEALMKQYHGIRWEIGKHISSEQSHALDDSEQLALLESLRDNILLVLGRRLKSEQEKEAREWLKSPDTMLLDDAERTFEEIGGHDAEVREAQQAESRIWEDAKNALRERRNVSPTPAPPPVAPGNSIEMHVNPP